MSFIIAYVQGWWQTILKIRMWLLLYVLNLLFALLAALPLFNILEEKASRSISIEKLLPGFDFQVVQDFLNQYGDMLTVVFNQSRVLFVLYFVFAVFFTGGILTVFKNIPEKLSLRTFWGGCSYYFWRLLRLTVYFLALHGLVLALFWGLFTAILGGGIFDAENELYVYRVLKFIIPAYLLVAGMFFVVQDYAKVHIIHQDKGFLFRPFWQSFGLVFKNFLPVFLLALLNVLTFSCFTLLYWLLSKPALDNSTAIHISFIIGQAFLFARIGTKLLNLASTTILYKKLMMEKEPRQNNEPPAAIIAQAD